MVEKVANVSRVPEADDEDVTPCRIVVNGFNIHELLVEQDFAIYKDVPKTGKKVSTPCDFTRIQNTVIDRRNRVTPIDTASRSASFEDSHFTMKGGNSSGGSTTKVADSSVREPIRSYDQYKALFAAIERPMLDAVVHNKSVEEDPEEEFCAAQSIIESAFIELDDSDVEPDDIPSRGYVVPTDFDPTNAPSDSSTFDPFDASTPASSVSSVSISIKHWSRQHPFSQFNTIRLKKTTYEAKPVSIVNSLHIWIQPENTRHEAVWKKMSRYINQKNVPAPPRASIDLIEPGFLCLAIYNEDSRFYRAMVQSYDGVLDKVQIVFIDYMNLGVVSASGIHMCPPKVAQIPLQSVLVRMRGVKRNSRWSELRVVERLGESLHDAPGSIQMVVVKTATDDQVAEVELRDKHGPILRDMIAERYYDVVKHWYSTTIVKRMKTNWIIEIDLNKFVLWIMNFTGCVSIVWSLVGKYIK